MPSLNSKHQVIQAFSLIEVTLIVAMVAVVFVGVMSLTTRSLQMENVIKNDFIAQGLLREGVELAEAMRNENVAGGLYFAKDFVDLTSPGNPCLQPAAQCPSTIVFDWRNVATTTRSTMRSSFASNIGTVPATSTVRLKLSADSASTTPPFYQLASGSNTPFYRYFEILYVTSTPAIDRSYMNVVVKVYWEERGKGHTSQALSRLYDTQN